MNNNKHQSSSIFKIFTNLQLSQIFWIVNLKQSKSNLSQNEKNWNSRYRYQRLVILNYERSSMKEISMFPRMVADHFENGEKMKGFGVTYRSRISKKEEKEPRLRPRRRGREVCFRFPSREEPEEVYKTALHLLTAQHSECITSWRRFERLCTFLIVSILIAANMQRSFFSLYAILTTWCRFVHVCSENLWKLVRRLFVKKINGSFV